MDTEAFRRASIALVVGLVLVAAGIALPLAAASEDLSTNAPGPRGASTFGSILHEATRQAGSPPPRVWQGSLAELPEPSPRAGLVVLAPTLPFSQSEAEAVERFLERGGRVLVADDVGEANSLLERLPTRTRVVGTELIDLAYSRQPHFPVLYSIRPHPLTQNVGSLLANGASAIRPDANASVVIASSDSSWLDAEGDGLPSPGDERGPHAVMVSERIGRGELIVLSDPTLFANDMIDRADNRVLAENVGRLMVSGTGQLHVDETHRDHRPFSILAGALPGAPLDVRAALLLVLTGLGAAAYGAAVGLGRLRTLLEARRRPKGVVETVLSRHPQWAEQDVRDLARHLLTTRSDDDG